MEEEWGPWIEHDGAGIRGIVPEGAVLMMRFQPGGWTVGEGLAAFSLDHPCFFWRWKEVRTGWFSRGLLRVCDDPRYAAIIRYRIRKPRGLIMLESLLADLPEQVDA